MDIDAHVAALERELAGYEADGRTDRAALVRRELTRLRGPAPREHTAADPAPERADAPPTRRRVSRS